jgi:tyrosinase
MATYTRSNAWNNGGTFANSDLLWYAKGVGAMMARALNDPASWWFFAAIHGEYVTENGFPGWGSLPAPPAVPTTPVPSQSVWDEYWDQCQHQSWYFLPWHRGYLIALEAQVRAAVVSLGGPSTWALPYWDYFGPNTQFDIPPAFTQPALPDGTRNPLFVDARYGPDGDGNIFVPTPEAIKQHPNDPNFGYGPVTQDCMSNDIFTGSDAVTPPPGFGGPQTGFSHGGGTSGNIENNPHNLVHVYVGGSLPDGSLYGLMSDPGLAGLDPIFYLHHCNIDRMWAVWNTTPANTNPNDQNWLKGPAAIGEHDFVMPMPDGSAWVYTPQQMSSLSQLNYTYDSLPVTPAPTYPLAQRLTRLGAPAAVARATEGAAVTTGQNMELVGASREAIPIKGAGATTSVKLDPVVRSRVSASLARAAETAAPDRVFLNLENVRGTHDASVLSVYINLPEGAKPGDHPELMAGSVGLFGLRSASAAEGAHAGQGLNFVLDITKVIDTLHLDHGLDADALQVRIVPHRPIPDQAEITVGRISVYRQGV